MCQLSICEMVSVFVFEASCQMSGPATNGILDRVVVTWKEHPDRCFEYHLECDGNSETRRSSKPFVSGDMGTVKAKEKSDFLLGQAGGLSAGADIIRQLVICHGKGVVLHRAMKCKKIRPESKGGKPAKTARWSEGTGNPVHHHCTRKTPRAPVESTTSLTNQAR
jgi:hypothetical protein